MSGLIDIGAILSLLAASSFAFHIQPRIINGVKSAPDAFPFYVLVRDGLSLCGGSVIDDRWILTAAHCVSTERKIMVYLGFQSIDNYDKVAHIQPANQYIFPGFNESKYDHDIALLELPSNVTLGPNAKVATLPGDCHATHKPNETVLITGTGDVTIEDTAYNTLPMLRQATTTTMSGGECASTINTDMDQRSLICARVTDGQAAYEGDSGGPLVRAEDGTLIGVMMVVFQYEEIMDPMKRFTAQIAANIPYYFEWIADVTGLQLPKC